MGISSAEFRRALGAFATGVTIITVSHESPGEASKIEGMTANAFTSVSLDPPLVLVCVDHDARTHAHLHARKRFGINVLAESHDGDLEVLCRPGADAIVDSRPSRS
jgi:flavin reductase (DIM6/NTAB) family NADH-FMN oxidoreductase RutF